MPLPMPTAAISVFWVARQSGFETGHFRSHQDAAGVLHDPEDAASEVGHWKAEVDHCGRDALNWGVRNKQELAVRPAVRGAHLTKSRLDHAACGGGVVPVVPDPKAHRPLRHQDGL